MASVHMLFVASQPCIISGYQGEYGVGHHLLRSEPTKGIARKQSDIWIVPLHSTLHDALHKNGNEIAFFANHGLDYDDVKERALYLASISPDPKIRKLAKEYLNGN
jgi:hypothetical protein